MTLVDTCLKSCQPKLIISLDATLPFSLGKKQLINLNHAAEFAQLSGFIGEIGIHLCSD
jgi:hypothetical protein